MSRPTAVQRRAPRGTWLLGVVGLILASCGGGGASAPSTSAPSLVTVVEPPAVAPPTTFAPHTPGAPPTTVAPHTTVAPPTTVADPATTTVAAAPATTPTTTTLSPPAEPPPTVAAPSTATPTTTIPPGATATVPPATVAPPAIDAAAYAVYDTTQGRWLAEYEAAAPRPVGSLMKLLTAYVVMQAGDPTHIVTVPAIQLDPMESVIGLYAGEQLQRDLLVRAMLIVSANDAARALATDLAGSDQAFAALMNDAATTLGLSSTVAANPVGLDAPGAGSSAHDLTSLAAVLMQDPTFRETVARTDARLHGQVFPATNDLLTTYPGAVGVKTGRTTDAGWCIVGAATRDGRTVIVTVLGAPSDAARVASASTLLDWAFTTT